MWDKARREAVRKDLGRRGTGQLIALCMLRLEKEEEQAARVETLTKQRDALVGALLIARTYVQADFEDYASLTFDEATGDIDGFATRMMLDDEKDLELIDAALAAAEKGADDDKSN